MHHPIIDQFKEHFLMAHVNEQAIRLVGSDTKKWYGNPVNGQTLSTKIYKGIVDYSPAESVVTVRAGTSVQELLAVLAEQNQTLDVDLPLIEQGATIGGAVASGLTGSSRPFSGAIKDYVLGVSVLDAKGHFLEFGGKVFKNVAGYDISRLYVGSHGILGLILDINLRVCVRPEIVHTIRIPANVQEALAQLPSLRARALPITGAVWSGAEQAIYIRLAGTATAVQRAKIELGGDSLSEQQQTEWWASIGNYQHIRPTEGAIRCVQVPAHTPLDATSTCHFIDWGGALRWSYYHGENIQEERAYIEKQKGQIAYFHLEETQAYQCFHPLSPGLQTLHYRLKDCFDSANILNPKRLYHFL